MKAIETRYLGPTDTRGSRIAARDSDDNHILIPCYDGRSMDENHKRAAQALCQKMGWAGTLQGGHTSRGHVWVWLNDDDQISIPHQPKTAKKGS